MWVIIRDVIPSVIFIIFSLTLFFFGERLFKIRMKWLFLSLAGGVALLTLIIHPTLNATYADARCLGCIMTTTGFVMTPHNFQRLTGDLIWRFLHWGIFYGDVTTVGRIFFLDTFGLDRETGALIDVTNPTPLMLIIWSTVLSGIKTMMNKTDDQDIS